MTSKTILIVDDDEKLIALLEGYLQNFGFQVLTATHPKDGIDLLSSQSPDLMILDLMLPDQDGFEVCKTVRKQSSIPILMLTARGDVMDRVVGLELGADDYLPKPFEPRELVARIQSILRRVSNNSSSETENKSLSFGELTVNFPQRAIWLKEQSIDLTTTEFAVLELLIQKAGTVLSRDDILDALHGIEWDAFNRSVDITMSRLRQKLKDSPKNPRFIKTIWGTGYVFIGKPS